MHLVLRPDRSFRLCPYNWSRVFACTPKSCHMASIPISADSGSGVGTGADASNSEVQFPTASDSSGSSGSSGSESSDSESSGDDGETSRRRRIPSSYRERKNKFWNKVHEEKFWDVRDKIMWLLPLSRYFLENCAGESDYLDDVGDLILPSEVEEEYADVPTKQVVDSKRLLVKLEDKMFYLALRQVQGLLRKEFKIEWLTLPFSLSEPQENNKLFPDEAVWASDTHKEALRLFAKTVNKMHEVKLLVKEANARGTEATRGFQRKLSARAYVETVRKNMWILNNQFAYDKTLGGFYRAGDRAKGAIARITSHAAAAVVKGGIPTVRPPEKERVRRQHSKRPLSTTNAQNGSLTDAPSENQPPHRTPLVKKTRPRKKTRKKIRKKTHTKTSKKTPAPARLVTSP